MEKNCVLNHSPNLFDGPETKALALQNNSDNYNYSTKLSKVLAVPMWVRMKGGTKEVHN